MRQDFVLAYAYISLAADQEFDLAVSSLQRLKNKMTPEQITEAQQLATEWKPR